MMPYQACAQRDYASLGVMTGLGTVLSRSKSAAIELAEWTGHSTNEHKILFTNKVLQNAGVPKGIPKLNTDRSVGHPLRSSNWNPRKARRY